VSVSGLPKDVYPAIDEPGVGGSRSELAYLAIDEPGVGGSRSELAYPRPESKAFTATGGLSREVISHAVYQTVTGGRLPWEQTGPCGPGDAVPSCRTRAMDGWVVSRSGCS